MTNFPRQQHITFGLFFSMSPKNNTGVAFLAPQCTLHYSTCPVAFVIENVQCCSSPSSPHMMHYAAVSSTRVRLLRAISLACGSRTMQHGTLSCAVLPPRTSPAADERWPRTWA